MFVFVRDAQQIHDDDDDDDDDDADAFGRWERKNNQDHSCWECDKLYKLTLQFEISKHSGSCRMNQILFSASAAPQDITALLDDTFSDFFSPPQI